MRASTPATRDRLKADNVVAHRIYADDQVPSAHVMGGPQAHWAKLAFERYLLTSRKHGETVF